MVMTITLHQGDITTDSEADAIVNAPYRERPAIVRHAYSAPDS